MINSPQEAAKKAAAFDRIAEAFLKIPAGQPTYSEFMEPLGKLLEVVSETVVAIHPAYQKKEDPRAMTEQKYGAP